MPVLCRTCRQPTSSPVSPSSTDGFDSLIITDTACNKGARVVDFELAQCGVVEKHTCFSKFRINPGQHFDKSQYKKCKLIDRKYPRTSCDTGIPIRKCITGFEIVSTSRSISQDGRLVKDCKSSPSFMLCRFRGGTGSKPLGHVTIPLSPDLIYQNKNLILCCINGGDCVPSFPSRCSDPAKAAFPVVESWYPFGRRLLRVAAQGGRCMNELHSAMRVLRSLLAALEAVRTSYRCFLQGLSPSRPAASARPWRQLVVLNAFGSVTLSATIFPG